MKITLIAAMAQNWVIGQAGQLPWHLPADLKHFKTNTSGKPILMGRLTYESIGRPLPNRRNLVLTRDINFTAPGVDVFNGYEAVLDALGAIDELMVIGGGQVYRALLPASHRILLTVIHSEVEGDAFFPNFDLSDWTIHSQEKCAPDSKNAFSYSFLELRRDQFGRSLPADFPLGLDVS